MSRERTEPYKEDSTKGGSLLINPLNYKGDALVQVSIDSRLLATLSNWLEKEGKYVRFMTEVIRVPLEALAAHLVDTGEVELVDDTNTARMLIERRYGVNLNKSGKNKKNLLHNQLLSNKRLALSEKMSEGNRYNDAQIPMNDRSRNKKVDPEILNEAVKRFNEESVTSKEEISRQATEAISRVKESGKLATEVRRLTSEEIEQKDQEVIERDKETLARENAPVDLEFLRKNVVKL